MLGLGQSLSQTLNGLVIILTLLACVVNIFPAVLMVWGQKLSVVILFLLRVWKYFFSLSSNDNLHPCFINMIEATFEKSFCFT